MFPLLLFYPFLMHDSSNNITEIRHFSEIQYILGSVFNDYHHHILKLPFKHQTLGRMLHGVSSCCLIPRAISHFVLPLYPQEVVLPTKEQHRRRKKNISNLMCYLDLISIFLPKTALQRQP